MKKTVQVIKWRKIISGTEYFVEYRGMTFFGNVLLSVNGEQGKFTPTYRKEDGFWVIFYCGSSECLLNISKDRNSARLLSQGEKAFITGGQGETAGEAEGAMPAENTAAQAAAAGDPSFPSFAVADLNRKVRNGTGTFFSILILSLINLPLIYGNLSISFPFSIFASEMAAGIGSYSSSEAGGDMIPIILSLAFAITVILVYGVLYYFSFRSTALVWVTFAMMVFDTLLLVIIALLSESLGDFVINLAFHAWILWTLAQLGVVKAKLKKAVWSRIPLLTEETACEYDIV